MGAFIDLTGRKFSRLLVEGLHEKKKKVQKNGKVDYRILWDCLCDCGEKCVADGALLRNGGVKSCGCLKSELSSARRKKDLTGQRFTKLLVLEEAYTKNYQVYWKCQCDCGNICYVTTSKLTSGTTKSCGCIIKDVMGPKLYVDITGMRSGKLVARCPTELRSHRQVLWICDCDCGGQTLTNTTDFLSGHVASCGCVKSKGEESIAHILKRENLIYKKNYKFDDLFLENEKHRKTRLMFDFALLRKDGSVICVIEFQGIQHYTPTSRNGFGDQQRLITDPMKREYCKNKNIILYEIRYDENIEERMREILCMHVNSVGNEAEAS